FEGHALRTAIRREDAAVQRRARPRQAEGEVVEAVPFAVDEALVLAEGLWRQFADGRRDRVLDRQDGAGHRVVVALITRRLEDEIGDARNGSRRRLDLLHGWLEAGGDARVAVAEVELHVLDFAHLIAVGD